MKTKTVDNLWALAAAVLTVGGLVGLGILAYAAYHFAQKFW
jgi:uncharacterized membrane protein YebE (DUF533 family)